MARFEIDAIDPKDGRQNLVTAVIETPAGSRNKFVYEEDLGFFRLHKILPMGSAFPFDFGFIPGTLAEDGDPLDLLVLGEEATFTGCVVTVRLLGVIQALQTEGRKTIRNDRLMRGSRIQDRETARARDGAQASRTGSPETHGSSDEATSGNLRTPRSFIVEPAPRRPPTTRGTVANRRAAPEFRRNLLPGRVEARLYSPASLEE